MLNAKAKPFVKWAGGKSQLIGQLEEQLPNDFDAWENVTYIEPFVGGGAMLFHFLQTHANVTRAVINDINSDLTNCCSVVKTMPEKLILSLQRIQKEFRSLSTEQAKKEFYLLKRQQFNTEQLEPVENASLFIFINRTCFNGLYRVNKSGKFNVPFGRYDNPTICDENTIMADSSILQKVKILTGDYQQTLQFARGRTFFYFDPPYRPLSITSSFNDYSKEAFDDREQVRLKGFCDKVDQAGYCFMLSNSDCSAKNPNDRFFENLYLPQYSMTRVWASRSVNSIASKRGRITEILVRNYKKTKVLPQKTYGVK